MVVAGTFEKLVEHLACEEKPGKYTVGIQRITGRCS